MHSSQCWLYSTWCSHINEHCCAVGGFWMWVINAHTLTSSQCLILNEASAKHTLPFQLLHAALLSAACQLQCINNFGRDTAECLAAFALRKFCAYCCVFLPRAIWLSHLRLLRQLLSDEGKSCFLYADVLVLTERGRTLSAVTFRKCSFSDSLFHGATAHLHSHTRVLVIQV